MTNGQDALIVELARQLSQESEKLYTYLGEDLDRRMGAALGLRRTPDVFPSSPKAQLAIRVADGDTSPDSSIVQELKSVPHP